MVESGQLAAAAEELSELQVAVEQVGGPVSGWHLDRVTAYVAQAQGRSADADATGRRAFERMRRVEPGPAQGAFFALQCALASHVGVTGAAAEFVQRSFDPLPRFRTMSPIARSFLLLCAGLPDEAAASYQRAGPIETWSLPAFFVVPGHVLGALAAADLGRYDDLAVLLERLDPLRGEYAVAEGVFYMGPIDLTLGRGAAALGRLDVAVEDLGFRSNRPIGPAHKASPPRPATTWRQRCSLATVRAIATVPCPPPATPTAWREPSECRRTSSARPLSSPTSAQGGRAH